MYGLGVCLDAVLILLVDVAAGNYNCKAITACVEDATSDACDCVVGDSFKLYERFLIDVRAHCCCAASCGALR